MASDISIKVTSDISSVNKDLNKMADKIDDLGAVSKKADGKLDDLGDSAQQANKKLDDLGEGGKKASDGIEKIAKLEALDALDRIGGSLQTMSNGIIDFGTTAVQASAKWQALNAQWTQVWGDLAIQADVSVRDISESTGILPNLLKPAFLKIGAFAKTTGMDTKDALDLSSRALRATADSAAFYDRSIEDTAESLQSFLKGNYENDAALGLSATETTRNTKANELFGKSFIDLSEDQKQLTLLGMVEEANELSGAFGQAGRESDGLETQMGNLKQAVEDFMAQIGNEILPIFIGVIKELGTWIKDLSYWIHGIPEPLLQFMGGLALGVVIVGQLLPLVTGLMTVFTLLSIGLAPFALIVGGIILAIGLAVVAFLNWDATVKLFQQAWEAVLAFLNENFPQTMAMVTEVVNWFSDNWKSIQGVIAVTWDIIVGIIKTAIDVVKNLIKWGMQVIDTTMGTTWRNIKTVISGTWENIKTIVKMGLDVIQGIIKVVTGIIKGDWKMVWDGIKQVFGGIWDGMKALVKTNMGTIKDVISNTWGGIKGIWDATLGALFKNVSSTFKNIKDTIKNVIDTIKEFFNFELKFPTISIPHIPLPHFSLEGSFNPLKGEIPSIGVDWYAKGGIMTSTTAFGMNGSNMMVGGEAGNEAILPLNHRNLSVIGAMIADTMDYGTQSPMVTSINVTIQGDVDSNDRINQLTTRIANVMETQYTAQNQFN